MKATIDGITIEGTVEEVLAYQQKTEEKGAYPKRTYEQEKNHYKGDADKTGKLWTAKEDDLITIRRQEGKTFKEIGQELGRTAAATEKRESLTRLARTKGEKQETEKPAQKYELHKEKGKEPQKTVTEPLYRWTPQDDTELLNLKKLGLNDKEIAKQINRTINALRVRYHKIRPRTGNPTILEEEKTKREEKKESPRPAGETLFPRFLSVRDDKQEIWRELIKNLIANGGYLDYINTQAYLDTEYGWEWKEITFEFAARKKAVADYFGVKDYFIIRTHNEKYQRITYEAPKQ